MCNHSIRIDYRYIIGVNQRQCRWCGCNESDKLRQEQQVESSG